LALAPVTNAGLSAGDLLVADTNAGTVYRYTAASSFATRTTLASGLNQPFGVAFDSLGNLLVAETGNNDVLKYLASNYTSSVVEMTNVTGAEGIALDPSGNIFLTAYGGSTVTELSPSFAPVAVASTSPVLSVNFRIANGAHIGSFNVLDAGLSGQEFNSASGSTCTTGTYSAATTCTVNFIFTPAYPGTRYGSIQALDPSNNILATGYFGGTGTGPNAITGYNTTGIEIAKVNQTVGGVQIKEIVNSVIDAVGNVYVSDPTGSNLFKFTRTGPGTYTGAVVSLSGVSISGFYFLAIDGAGTVYTDNGSNVASIVNGVASNVSLGSYTLGSRGVSGLGVSANGNLYVSDSGNRRIIVVPPNSGTPYLQPNFPAGDFPQGVIADSSGIVYYNEANSNTIKSIAPTGTVATVYTLTEPTGNIFEFNFDANGNLLYGDHYSGGIYSVSPSTGTLNSLPISTNGAATNLIQAGNGDYIFASEASGHVTVFPGNPSTSTSLSFLSSDVGVKSTDSPQSVTFYNEGNAALVVAVPGTGNNPSIATGFAYDSGSSCQQLSTSSSAYSLTAGANCTYKVDFIPAAVGSNTGSLVLTDNASNSPQSISLSGTGIAPVDTTSTTVSIAPSSVVVGQTVNITATVADTQSGHTSTVPTGTATFTDTVGTTITSLNGGNPVNLSGGVATLSGVLLSGVGTHTISATYAGVSGTFLTSSGSNTAAMGKSSVTLPGPNTQPVIVFTGQTGSVPMTVIGQYAGAGIPVPTGTISYSILNSSNVSVASGTQTVTAGTGNSTATIPVPNTLAAGSYTVSVTYGGDTNFAARSSATIVTLTINNTSVTVTGPATQPVNFYNSQSGSFLVTVTAQSAGSGIPLPSGSINYTIVNASSTSVASGTVALTQVSVNSVASIPVPNTLAAGSYTATATYSGDTNYAAPSTATTIPLTISQIQPVISWSKPSAIVYGTTLSGVLNATALNESTPSVAVKTLSAQPQFAASTVPGTYVYTATPTGGTAATVTATTLLAAGSYTLNVSFTPTNTTTFKSATGSTTLTVTQATPGIVLTSNSNPVLVQNSITLTATLSLSAGTPTGTVTFNDGATTLGTGTVNSSGVATYSTAALAVGTHTITAVYPGDTNFVNATSNVVSEVVQDFNLVISISSGSTGVTTVTAQPGGTAVYTFTLSPVGSTTFPATVTLSASGLPTGATYVFSPATLAAGTGSTTVTLTIQLPQTAAVNEQPDVQHSAQPAVLAQNKPASRHTSGLPYLALAVLLLPFAGRMRRTGKKLGRLLPLFVLLIAGLAATAGLSGCSSLKSGYFGQLSTTYTISVTGTSGTLTHSTSVTLIVQ
jgi:hypothetical protein